MSSSPLGYNPSLDQPIDEPEPAQQSLRDCQLRMVFETSLDAIALADEEGRYLDVNSATCELFGLERDELLGRGISEFVEPGFDFPAPRQAFQQQEKMRGEFQLVRTDGESRIVEYAATANFLPHRHLLVMRDITECKRAEAQVQELTRQLAQTQAQLQETGIEPVSRVTPPEYHRLEQIVHHIPGVIYQFRQCPDGTFHFPYASDGIQEIYGVTPEEVREDASKVFGLIHPDDLDRLNQSILESAEHLTPWYCEYQVCLPDGRVLWLLGHATPQREPDGSTLWHGYIRDITDSKRAEADNQRLLAILESTSDLIGTIDVTGKALYLNRAWRNLLDINNEAAIADMEISKAHPEWALDIIFNQGLPSAARSGIWQGETAILDRTGGEIPVSQVILAHKSTDGEVEYFSTIIRDISESKRAEADSKRLLAILESTSDLIGTIDLTGKALYINRAWRNLLDLNDAAIADMEISKAHPEWALDIIFNQGLPEAVRSGSWQGETAILDRTGGEIPVSQVILAHKSTDGEVEYFSTSIRDISESKATELALRISENKFRSIIENLNDMVYIINPDATFSYVSTQFKEIMGYELAELLDWAFADWIYPEDLPICVDAIHRSLQGEKLRGIEYRVLHQDGNYYWHSSNLSALRDEDGQIIACLGIARYIHDRKQAEIENWQMQNFLNSIIENIPNMVFVKEVEHLRFVRFNKAGEELLGYPKEALLGKSDYDFFPPDEADFFTLKDREVLTNSKVWDIPEEPIQTTHQGTRILHTKKIPIFDELGNPQYLLGISEDITERKQAEAKLIEITQLQQAILDGANYALISTDTNGIIKTFNAAAQRFLGYSSAEMVDKVTPAIFHDIEEINQRAAELTAELDQPIAPGFEVFVAKARLGMFDENEWSYIRKDGSRFPVQLSVSALRDEEGTITGFLGIASDITERKEAETKLNEISERLSLALKSGGIGCWEWDLVQNTLVWDERMYELYGATKNSDSRLAYDIWANGLHPDDRDASEILIRQAVLGKAEFNPEFRVVHPDGTIHFIKAFGLVRRDAEGNPQKMIGVNFDISDRKAAEAELKQAQAELKETEKFLRSIYEGVGSLIFVVDVVENRELIYTGWSLSTEKATGILAADAIGKTPESIFGLTEGAAVRQNHLRCIESGTSIAYEECLTFNDQETWWLTILNPIKNSDNRISRIVGTTINISDRKRQEQALRLIVEGTAAKTGEEFFKSCVQYLAQVLEVRYASIAEFVNQEKSIARTLVFWSGDKFGNNFTCNLAGTACKNTPCKNISSDAEVCLYPNSVECLFPGDDTLVALKTESYAGLPIMDAAGNQLGLLEVMDTNPMVKDLEMQSAILKIFATRAGAEMERIQAEAALRQSEIQLRQQTQELETTLQKLQNTQIQLIQAEKMSSLGQLVAGVAHEINNPVSFIYSNIQPATDYASDLIELIHLYQEHYPSPPQAISDLTEDIEFEYLVGDVSKLLESMKTGATRIRDIVKSLRTFSRLDEADLKEIDIHENIESTLVILQNRLNGRAGKPEINLTKNYGKLPLVECYGGLLNQVFMNLLVNAIDAIEQRRDNLEPAAKLDYIGRITIATSLTSENQVWLSFQDNGCGMSPEVQEKIFNPFFTTKPIGKGTGMGLATSYQIVTENHQGHLRCFSTLGQGTEFRIELSVGQ